MRSWLARLGKLRWPCAHALFRCNYNILIIPVSLEIGTTLSVSLTESILNHVDSHTSFETEQAFAYSEH
jgi:hypothetical protein